MSTEPFIADPDIAKRFSIVRDFLKNKYDIKTQTDFAAIFSVTQGQIGHVLNGRRAVTIDMLKTLFIKFNINPNFILIGGDEDMEYKKPGKTLITDTRELRAEIEVLSARMKKMEQDMRILSQKLP